MPTFYCHIRSEKVFIEDAEGAEYSSIEAAWRDAVVSAKHIIGEALRMGGGLRCALQRTFEIMDENGQQVAVLPFAEAAEVELQTEGGGSPSRAAVSASKLAEHPYQYWGQG